MAIVDTLAWVTPLLMSVLGVILNLLSMGAILSFKTLRKTKNIFISHLSFCDFVASICIVITYIKYLTQLDFSTSFVQHTFGVALVMSLLSTLAIAVERFIIFYLDPFGNRKIITPFRTTLAFLVSWACVNVMFYLMGYLIRESLYRISKVILSSSIWIAIIVTAAFYGIIYQKITSASKGIGASDTFLQRRYKVHQKIIVTFSLVVGTTGLCWLPLTVTEFLKAFPQVHDTPWFIALDRIFFSILCLNQVLNPIIVWSRMTEFRDKLKVCRRGEREGDRGENNEQTNLTSVSANVPVNIDSRDNSIFTMSP
ncbi:adenosine receptor A3-like [Lytechinus variegatus]|uniref:adenosine receptor A3-like n=1 Tax=Lytechinus variegatus TaxID=7654 RepID=UPI001BB2C130|nr:adenosine receptor A3-like [Lytechinus variegatus]